MARAIIAAAMSRRWTVPTLLVAGLIYAMPGVSAQIMEDRVYRGKTITYMLSGLQGWGSPCGTDGNYAYIFVGSVQSATEISETEKRLQVTPEEMFLGDAASRLTITTNQGACLPEILPGDEWLFYLWRDDKTKELMLGYGSPSQPIADAQPAITRLRRLAAMTDLGIIAGYVTRPVWHDDDKYLDYLYPPNHKIVAQRESNGAEYSAVTDSDGDFEFEPLPAGPYHLSANTAKGLWAEEGPATVHSRGCESFAFELHADGEISGHVKSADGKPFKIHPWVEIKAVDGGRDSKSSYVDDHGYFEARGLEPGRYLVGIGIRAEPNAPEWQSRVYYPGVQAREKATVITLGKAEKRTNIDFQLLSSSNP
jgi:hypothetical protein